MAGSNIGFSSIVIKETKTKLANHFFQVRIKKN